MFPSRLPTTPGRRPSPLSRPSASEDRRRDDLSQAAQQAATGNHRTPHFCDRKSFRREGTTARREGRVTIVCSVLNVSPWEDDVGHDHRQGLAARAQWPPRRIPGFLLGLSERSSPASFFSPVPKPLPSFCALHDRPGPFGPFGKQDLAIPRGKKVDGEKSPAGQVNSFDSTRIHLYKTKSPSMSTTRKRPV
jgi:hypothetical protein